MFLGSADHEVSGRREGPPPATTSLSPRGGALHRTMKEHILKSLKEAGGRGKTVEELADELGVLKSRVQSWFSGTGKRVKGLKKIGVGRWKYVRKGKPPV